MIARLRNIAAVLLTAAILYGMQHTMPLYSDITSPVPFEGRQGERVDAHTFAIGIAEVHLARRITISSYGGTHTYSTSGVWALVEAAAKAKKESLPLASAEWLGPDGVRYALTRRFSTVPGLLGSERLEPGIPRPVLMAFEVPESQLAGATLLVSRSAYTPLSEEARIVLTSVDPDDIRSEIVLERGDRSLPWKLEAM